MAENSLKFDFIGRDRSASSTFEKIGKESEGLGHKLTKMGATTAFAMGSLAVTGITKLKDAFVDGFKAADVYQQLNLKTAAVIKSTGDQAHISVKGVDALASQLESLGTTDEELIINSQNVLATFTSIRNVGKNRIFDEAERSTLDMSVALGENLQNATIQVGKALNDPIKGVSALSKVGVSFTAQQKAQIKTMVDSGHTMDAQKVILKELNKEFGGAAKAAGSGFSGAIFRAKDALGDLQRDLSAKAMPALTGLADWATNVGVPKLRKFTDWMGTTGGPRLAKGFTVARAKATQIWNHFDFTGIGARILANAKTWGTTILAGVNLGLKTGDWSQLGATLGDGLSAAVGAGGGLGKQIVKAVGSIDWFKIGSEAGLAALPFAIGFMSHLGNNLFTVMKEHPFDFAVAVVSIFGIGKIGGRIAAVLDHIPFLKAFAPLFRGLESITAPVNKIVGRFFTWMGDEFRGGFVRAIPETEGGIAKLTGAIGDRISGAAKAVGRSVERMVGGFISGLGESTGNALKAVGRFITRILSPFTGSIRWLVGKGRDVVGGMASGINSMGSAISRTMSRTIGKVTSPFVNAGRWLFSAGRSIISGLFGGMLDMVRGAGNVARTVGSRIVSSIKGFFGIHSPSKVMWGLGSNMINSLFGAMIDHNPVQAITKIFGSMPKALGALVDKGMVSIGKLPGKALNALSSLGGKFASLFGGGGGGNVRIGGLSAAESYIIMHESGNRTTAANPTSTAFGLGQLLLANRQHYGQILGVSSATTNYAAQLAMFRMYVRDRYGTAENAARFWKAHHWYDAGGMATGMGWMAKRTLRPERVLSPAQTVSFDRLTRVLDRRPQIGAQTSTTDIDYAKLGQHVARALSTVTVTMDGKVVGRIIGTSADLLSRTG